MAKEYAEVEVGGKQVLVSWDAETETIADALKRLAADNGITLATTAGAGSPVPEEPPSGPSGLDVFGSGALYGGLELPNMIAKTAPPGGFESLGEGEAMRALVTGDPLPYGDPSLITDRSESPVTDILGLGEATSIQPQTPGQEWLRTGGEMLGSTMAAPGAGYTKGIRAVTEALASAAGATVGAEGLSQLTSSDNPIVQGAGSLVGDLLTTLWMSKLSNTNKLARKSLEGISEDELRAAGRVRQEAADAGFTNMTLGQALGRDTNLRSLEESIANQEKAPGALVERFRAQPEEARGIVNRAVENIPGLVRNPREIATELNSAAAEAVLRTQGRVDQRGAQVQSGLLMDIVTRLRNAAGNYGPQTGAHRTLNDIANRLGATVQQGPEATLAALQDEILRATRLQPRNAQQQAAKDQFLQTLRQAFADAGDAPAAGGRAAAALRRQSLDPMLQGPTGDIARSSDAGRGPGALGQYDPQYPGRPSVMQSMLDRGVSPGTRSDISILESDLRPINPAAVIDAVKTNLVRKVEEAAHWEGGSINEDFAARLNNTLFTGGGEHIAEGVREQLRAVGSAMGLTNPDEMATGFERMMRFINLEAARPEYLKGLTPRGTRTISRESYLGRLGRISVISPIRQPILRYLDFLETRTIEAFDEMLSTPQGLEMLLAFAKTDNVVLPAYKALQTFLRTSAAMNSPALPDITQDRLEEEERQ